MVWGAEEEAVRVEAEVLAKRVQEQIDDIVGDGWQSLGAAPCAIDKLRGQHRWHILIKAPAGADISKLRRTGDSEATSETRKSMSPSTLTYVQ